MNMHPLLRPCFPPFLGVRPLHRLGHQAASLAHALAILLVAFITPAWADSESPMFAGWTLTIHGTTFTWSSADEPPGEGTHTDTYSASEPGHSVEVRGLIAAPQTASISGSDPLGPVSGFWIQDPGAYLDATQVSSIVTKTQTFNGQVYNGIQSTITYQIAEDGSLVSYVTEEYARQTGTIFITTDPSGQTSVGGAVSGILFEGTWYLDYSGAVVVSPLGPYPVTLFGKTYSFREGIYNVSYRADATSNNAENDFYIGSDNLSTFRVHADDSSGELLISIFGNDPAIGSFEGSVQDGVIQEIIVSRDSPSFAPPTLWNYANPISWHDGTVVSSSGETIDRYFMGDENSPELTIIVRGYTGDFQPGGPMTAGVTVNAQDGGVYSGTYHGANGQFSDLGFELQVRDGTRNRAGAAYSVNGTTYAWTSGYDANNGSGQDRFENETMGSLTLSWNAIGVLSVDVTYDGSQYSGPFLTGVPLSGGAIEITILEQSSQLDGAPPAFWVDGLLYWRTSPTSLFYEGGNGNVIVISGSAGLLTLHGYGRHAFQGSYDGSAGAFSVLLVAGASRPAYPANLDGSAQLKADPAPTGLPPAIYLSRAGTFQYLGTRAGGNASYGKAGPAYADYYDAKRMFLEISPEGAVSLVGRLDEESVETGSYHSVYHLFQSSTSRPLPMPLYGVDPLRNYTAWGLVAAPAGRPPTILVDGDVWRYIGQNGGNDTYWGYFPGQVITIIPSNRAGAGTVTVTQPGGVAARTGTYYNGTFTMNGAGPALLAGNAAGAVVAATGAAQVQTITGDLDITGSILSLGAWRDNPGMAGLTLQYGESANPPFNASIGLTGSRPNTSFLFGRATTQGATTSRPLMQLDANSRLTLFDPQPASPAAPKNIILNPGGVSDINGVLRVLPGGDIRMLEPVNP